MDEKMIMTKEGYQKLLDEIEYRKNEVRNEIADEIDKARQQGDLSENAAYKSALEKKEFNEATISNLEDQVKRAVVEEKAKGHTVGLGTKVVLKDANGNKREFSLVGENEMDPLKGMISIKSPIGKALMGKKQGDFVTISLPSGEIIFEILTVQS